MSIITFIAFLYCFLHYIIFHLIKPKPKEIDSKEDLLIDDEIFFGQLSLNEIKLKFASNQTQRQTMAASELSEDDCNRNMSLQLISTRSEPDINKGKGILNSLEAITKAVSKVTISPNRPQLNDNFEFTSPENSLLKDETPTEESCETASEECLDNTLETIEKILNSAPKESPEDVAVNFNFGSIGQVKEYEITPSKVNNAYTNQQSTEKCLKSVSSPAFTPVEHEKNIKEVFATSSVLRSKPSQLKTPVNVELLKKPSTSSIKKTPSKNNAFKHIASPVAYYIHNSPQVPLVQNVKPRKHLTGISSIPKLVTSSAVKSTNKEYVDLPVVAYKSAKKNTVIDVSNRPKLPQSEWAKKLTDSLPRPAVIKHCHREKDFLNNNKSVGRRPEDSFGDLSVDQADVSVLTKKSAY